MTDQQAPMDEVCADDGTTTGDDGAREIYRERAHLVALLATIYPAVLTEHEPLQPAPSTPAIRDVVYLETSRGQLSWHLHPDDVDELFRHVRRVLPDDLAAQYDGHTTAEKYDRISQLTSDQARAFVLQRQDDERYIVEIGAEPPLLVGMNRLKAIARERIEDARHPTELDSLRIWRWLCNNGRTEQLALVPLTNPAEIPPGEWAEVLWELRSRSGMRHAIIEAQLAPTETACSTSDSCASGWLTNELGTHKPTTQTELGYSRRVCEACGMDWPCRESVQANDHQHNYSPTTPAHICLES